LLDAFEPEGRQKNRAPRKERKPKELHRDISGNLQPSETLTRRTSKPVKMILKPG
jgi:hypothetical protein